MTDRIDNLSEEEMEKNINEFLETHGSEGLFVLYYRDYIYRFIMQELKSADDTVNDSTMQLFFDPDGDEQLQTQREEMLDRCEYWARDLVKELKSDEMLNDIIESGNFSRLEDDDVEKRVERRLHEKMEEWKNVDLLDTDEEEDV